MNGYECDGTGIFMRWKIECFYSTRRDKTARAENGYRSRDQSGTPVLSFRASIMILEGKAISPSDSASHCLSCKRRLAGENEGK